MDASSTVAAAAAGAILGIFWVAASVYLFSYEKKDNNGVMMEDEKKDDKSYVYSWTFHIESLRFYGFINFIVVLGVGALITEYSGLDTILDPSETVLFDLFAFNHSCNWIDHNPSRMIASILIMPLVQIPMMLYSTLWHCRLAKDVKTGKVPKQLLNASRVLTPFIFISMAELHLWFVNNPDDTYGFIAHYTPYLMFQISLCLIHIMNVFYLSYKGDLPWGVPVGWARAYAAFFTALTIFSAVFVISTLAGEPILAVSRSNVERIIIRIFTTSWALIMILGNIVLAGKERTNGDVVMMTFGDKHGVALSLEIGSSDGGRDATDDDDEEEKWA